MTGGWHAQPGLRLSTIGAAASVLGLAPVGTRGRMRGGRSGASYIMKKALGEGPRRLLSLEVRGLRSATYAIDDFLTTPVSIYNGAHSPSLGPLTV